MTMTKKTVYISDTEISQELRDQISAKASELVSQGATDGYFSLVGDVRTRHWSNETTAAAWESWLTNFASNNGYSYTSFLIEDL